MTQIGPYEVVRELGRGGMGVVWLARDSELDEEIAEGRKELEGML